MGKRADTFDLVFPAGASAVRNFGTGKWAGNFFMPIPRNTYFEMHDEICRAYGKAIESLDTSKEPYLSWAVNYKITYQIAEYLYRKLFIDKLRAEGFESIYISSEIKLGDAEIKLPELLSFPVISVNRCIFCLVVEKWRAIRTNWGGCGFHRYLLPSVFTSSLYVLGGKGGGEVKAYLKDLGVEPVNLRPDLYIGKDSSSKFTSETETASGVFQNEMSGILKKYGLALPEGYWKDLSRYLDECSQLISGTRRKISGWARTELIINPVANLKHRVFASAWRLSGGSVTGTTHGNMFAYGNVPGDMINGSNIILNKLVTMSLGEKELFENARATFKTGLESYAEVYSCRNTIYSDMSKRLRKGSPVKSVKKVMLIGSPLNDDLQLSDRLCYLLMEIELVSLLVKNNYHVVYKAHPDTLDETKDLFDDAGCERSNDRFENVWESCDCILFPHVFTTVFGLSLMTSKHIIALSWKGNSAWNPEVLELLKKRICIINVDYSCDGKPFLDSQALLDSLSSPKEPDYSVVDKFALDLTLSAQSECSANT